MSMELPTPIRPVNNDRMAAFSAFRPIIPTHATPQSATEMSSIASSAAVVLPSSPAPKPTRLNEQQANGIVDAMQQENQDQLLHVHNDFDPERVAKLLSMLE